MNRIISTLVNLNPLEKKTFRIHLSYLLIEGIVTGVLALNEFIFIKSLKGSSYQLSILFMFSIVLLLMSLFLNEYLKRYRNKTKLLIAVGFITRLPLVVLLFFPASVSEMTSNEIYHYIFLAVFFIYYIAQPVVMPVMVQCLKSSYRHENFGKLYSYAATSNRVVMLVITFLFGLLLDFDNFSFRYIYPLIGILGIISITLLSRVSGHCAMNFTGKTTIPESVRNSWNSFVKIIRENKHFRDFEIGFMFYGYAWMSVSVLLNLFYDRAIHLNYSSTAFYKNIYNLIAIFLLPTFGRLIGKINLRKFSIMTYGFMLLMVIFTALTQYFPSGFTWMGLKLYHLMIIASIAYGFFAGAMPLLWDIGSAYFCSNEEVDTYQSIHISLTGVRGLFSPILGIWIFEQTGFTFAFGVAMLSLVVAMVFIHYSGKPAGAQSFS